MSEGLISRFGSIDPGEGGNTSRTNASAILTTALPHAAVLRQQAYYSRYYFNRYSSLTFFQNDPLTGDEIDQRDTGRNLYGYTATYDRDDDLGPRALHSTLGVGTRLDDGGLLLRRGAGDTLSTGRLHGQNVYAYLDEALIISDCLTVNAALRADLFVLDFRGQVADSAGALGPLRGRVQAARVSPKLNFYYQLSPAVQLFARSGLGFHSN